MIHGLQQGRSPKTWLTLLTRLASRRTSEQGVTLIECLIAIAVVGITSALILPPLFVAAGTRVQNHRAEQAMQLAQEEINRLQALSMNEEHQADRIPAVATGNNTYFTMNSTSNTIQGVPAPRAAWNGELRSPNSACNTYTPFNPDNTAAVADVIPLTNALAIDIDGTRAADGGCPAEFYMQVFRDFGTYADREVSTRVANQRRPTVYRAVVRVYSRAILAGTGNNNVTNNFSAFRPLTNPVVPASLQFTSGQGNQRERPLAVMTSLITWSGTTAANCGMRYQTARENGLNLPAQQQTNCRADVSQIP